MQKSDLAKNLFVYKKWICIVLRKILPSVTRRFAAFDYNQRNMCIYFSKLLNLAIYIMSVDVLWMTEIISNMLKLEVAHVSCIQVI